MIPLKHSCLWTTPAFVVWLCGIAARLFQAWLQGGRTIHCVGSSQADKRSPGGPEAQTMGASMTPEKALPANSHCLLQLQCVSCRAFSHATHQATATTQSKSLVVHLPYRCFRIHAMEVCMSLHCCRGDAHILCALLFAVGALA